jgi:outer membrane receptor for ferric coprogen and ferric-rhodotorulic acid
VVIEAGLKAAWHDGLLNGLLAVYRIQQRGLPRFDPDVPFAIIEIPGCCYTPADSTRSKGLDVELSGKLGDKSFISAGYTLNINHDPDGLPLSYQTPRHLLKLWTSTELPGRFSRLSVGASLHTQTRNGRSGTLCTLVSTSGCLRAFEFNVSQGTFAVAGVRAEYQLSDNWRVALNVDNLFDRTYYQTVGQPNTGNWYGEPRSFLVKVQGAF